MAVANKQPCVVGMNLLCEEDPLSEIQQKVYKEWEGKVEEYDELMKKHKEEEEKYQKAVKAVDTRVGLKDSEHQNANGPTKFLRSVATSSPQPVTKPNISATVKSSSQPRLVSSSLSHPRVASQMNTATQKSVNGRQEISYGGSHLNGKSPAGQLAPGVKMVVSVKSKSQNQRPPVNFTQSNMPGTVRPGTFSIQNETARTASKPNQPSVGWNTGKVNLLHPTSKIGTLSSVSSATSKQVTLQLRGSSSPKPLTTNNQASKGQKRPAEANVIQTTKCAKEEGINSKVLMTYYPFKKGKLLTTEDGSRRFKIKCFHCDELMASNIQYATHIKKLVESRLTDDNTLSICPQCFKRFRTSSERQAHQESSHAKGVVFQCFTCDLSFNNNSALMRHMDLMHTIAQMPFCCQICQYRTSAYADIMEHFSLKHEGFKALMCPYCIKILRCSKTFRQHCERHILMAMRGTTGTCIYPCKFCKLIFLSAAERSDHADKDHKRYDVRFRDGVPRYVRDTLKSLEIMASAGITGVSTPAGSRRPTNGVSKACMECGLFFQGLSGHFQSVHRCSVPSCSFSTFCLNSYDKHVQLFHKSPNVAGFVAPFIGHVKKKKNADRTVTLICKICNYQTKAPTHMAHHRAKKCVRRTQMEWMSYLYVPEQSKKEVNSASSKMVDVADVIVLDSEEDA